MQPPDSLVSLIDEGLVDEVLRPLMSGKEAQVFLVRSEGELRVAKVYKEAINRSFRQRAEYAEGRNVRNTRDQRAMEKRTKHGRSKDEAAWRSAEVDTIYRLQAAGVRVPVPYHFVDGVLIMELVADANGDPAPRLGDLDFDRKSAQAMFDRLLASVVGMLAAGVVHGDLSDFNVLVDAEGPVIIDFPQSVDASRNRNAKKLLVRDVDNLHRFLARYVPGRAPPRYAEEMWQLYERSELSADSKLTGRFEANHGLALTDDVLALIAEAERDEKRRRDALGIKLTGGRGHVPELLRPRPPQPRGPQDRPQPRGPQDRPQFRGPQDRPQSRGPQDRPPPHGPQDRSQPGRPGAPSEAAHSSGQPASPKPRRRRRRPPPGATNPGGR